MPDSEWFAQMADSSGLLFFVLRVKPDVAFEFVNDGPQTVLVGHRPEPGSTSDAAMILGRIDPAYADRLEAVINLPPGRDAHVELKWRHLGGSPTYSRGWIRSRQRADGTVVVEGALHDVTKLHLVEQELRNSERRHRLLAHNAWEVIWTMGLDGAITYVSPAVERVRGFTPAEAMRQTVEEIHPPQSAAIVGDYFAGLFASIAEGDEPPTFRGELEYYRKDGSIMVGELQVIPHVDADGKVVEILGVTRDISERKQFEAELTELAVTDPLTGLWNRRHTTDLLAADLSQAQRHGQALTLLMVDVDRFKSINDTHGHQTGDRVLIEIATRLREQVRSTDVVGRWGGEEFLVLLRHCGLRDAVAAAEKLRRRIAEVPFGKLFAVSVSIGAAELQNGEDLGSWLARADAALYEAKRAGRNTVATG
ncbi:MAG: diguanylate cyclase [Mycobacterium sp.]|nr:diguanylate cyclase [Mycobacterium sp.]